MLLLTAGRLTEQAAVDAGRLSPAGILEMTPKHHGLSPFALAPPATVVAYGLAEMLQFSFMDQKGAERRKKISISLSGSFVRALQGQ